MKWTWTTVAMVLVACGAQPSIQLQAHVRVDAQLQDEVARFDVYAYGDKRSDGIYLTCPNLNDQLIRPGDSRLDPRLHAARSARSGNRGGPDRVPPLEAISRTRSPRSVGVHEMASRDRAGQPWYRGRLARVDGGLAPAWSDDV